MVSERFLEQSKEGLNDLSKASHETSFHYSKDQIDIAIDFKLRNKTWRPKKFLVKCKKYTLSFSGYPLQDCPLGDLTACNDP